MNPTTTKLPPGDDRGDRGFAIGKPLFTRFMSADDFVRRRNLWLVLTAAAFLAPNMWLYVLVAGPAHHVGSAPKTRTRLPCICSFSSPSLPLGWRFRRSAWSARTIRAGSSQVAFAGLALAVGGEMNSERSPASRFGSSRRGRPCTEGRRHTRARLRGVRVATGAAVRVGDVFSRRVVLHVIDIVLPYFVSVELAAAGRRSQKRWPHSSWPRLFSRSWGCTSSSRDGWSLRSSANSGTRVDCTFRFTGGRSCALRQRPAIRSSWDISWHGVRHVAVSPGSRTSRQGVAVAVHGDVDGGLATALARGPGSEPTGDRLRLSRPGTECQEPRIARHTVAATVVAALTVSPWGSQIVEFLPFVGTVDEHSVVYREQLAIAWWSLIQQHPFFGSFFFLSTWRSCAPARGSSIS